MKLFPRIFIVEDDLFYARILQYDLTKSNLGKVETYNSGEDLINNLYKSPDIVILDYNLGSMLGIDVLKNIKKSNKNTKVILFSSYGSMKTVIECLRYGASNYIEKNKSGFEKIKKIIHLLAKNKKIPLKNLLLI
jgi:DNA-binding NtrC family response regulator